MFAINMENLKKAKISYLKKVFIFLLFTVSAAMKIWKNENMLKEEESIEILNFVCFN